MSRAAGSIGGRGPGADILRILALLLLVPFLCASLVVPGTMPVQDAQGRVTVVLCGDSHPTEMIVAADGGLTLAPDAGNETGGRSDSLPEDGRSCIWSTLAKSAISVEQAAVLPHRMLARLDLYVQPGRAAVPADIVPALARGPPVPA